MFDEQECVEEANQILLSAAWHEEHDPHGELNDSRNRVADLLKIPLTDQQRNVTVGVKSNSRSARTDEFESYSSLVNNA